MIPESALSALKVRFRQLVRGITDLKFESRCKRTKGTCDTLATDAEHFTHSQCRVVLDTWSFYRDQLRLKQQLWEPCVFKRTCYNLSSIQIADRLTYTERKSHAMRMIYSVVQHFFLFIILEPYFCYLLPKTTIDRCQTVFYFY